MKQIVGGAILGSGTQQAWTDSRDARISALMAAYCRARAMEKESQ